MACEGLSRPDQGQGARHEKEADGPGLFDSKGLIYTNFVPRGRTVNSAYIIEALARFLKVLKEKRPTMTAGTWWFHWDNAPVHTAPVVTNWMAARQFQIIEHPPYSPDLAPADFFLFPKCEEGAGRQNPHPGDPQEGVGGGRQNPLSGGLRHILHALG